MENLQRDYKRGRGVSKHDQGSFEQAGLDETASISSRAFELYVQQKTPVEVAIALNLKAKETIVYYHGYFMLPNSTEFTNCIHFPFDFPFTTI